MKIGRLCPACASIYTVYVHDVVGKRSRAQIPQYCCLDCRTFFNFSSYRETREQQKTDLDYLIEHQAHISKLQGQLVLEIKSRVPGLKSVCEIGYGSGLFLKACTDFGMEVHGFEANPYAAAYARDVVGVSCEEGLLTDEHSKHYDLLAAIGVFEHVEDPRALFGLMARHLNPDGAIYVNVPFFDREHWRFLIGAEDRIALGPPDPWYDNDVHIIHFSIDGLRRLGLSLGARTAEYFVSQDVVQRSPGAYPGILFRF
jgi:SAM-dependent methyltransferase